LGGDAGAVEYRAEIGRRPLLVTRWVGAVDGDIALQPLDGVADGGGELGTAGQQQGQDEDATGSEDHHDSWILA